MVNERKIVKRSKLMVLPPVKVNDEFIKGDKYETLSTYPKKRRVELFLYPRKWKSIKMRKSHKKTLFISMRVLTPTIVSA
jgi:hypothetical protein